MIGMAALVCGAVLLGLRLRGVDFMAAGWGTPLIIFGQLALLVTSWLRLMIARSDHRGVAERLRLLELRVEEYRQTGLLTGSGQQPASVTRVTLPFVGPRVYGRAA